MAVCFALHERRGAAAIYCQQDKDKIREGHTGERCGGGGEREGEREKQAHKRRLGRSWDYNPRRKAAVGTGSAGSWRHGGKGSRSRNRNGNKTQEQEQDQDQDQDQEQEQEEEPLLPAMPKQAWRVKIRTESVVVVVGGLEKIGMGRACQARGEGQSCQCGKKSSNSSRTWPNI